MSNEQHDYDGEPSDAEKLADALLERDFFAERLEDLLDQLGPIIVGMSHDPARQGQLLRIFFAADEAKCNAFWIVNFAGKK